MAKRIRNKKINVPFNLPHVGNEEFENIKDAQARGQLSGDGYYTKKCEAWIAKRLKARKALLTHSCTAALEMMAILSGVSSGDEIIMPSFTFVSTANAFVLRGAVPIFVDIRKDTLNINEMLIESAITRKTKAIMVVHYAGVSCEMDVIIKIAKRNNLLVFEDAAQSFLSKYKGRYSGTVGDMGAFSFHETKNIISGEGGALIVNNPKFVERAEVIREKGTNRNKFLRGEIDKYTWVDVGSSYLPGELISAFLFAQLRQSRIINRHRIKIWSYYLKSLKELEKKGYIVCPSVPENTDHNGHLFYIIVNKTAIRDRLIKHLRSKGVSTVFHYVPLHSSPAGVKYGRYEGSMKVTNNISSRLIRLPIYYDMKLAQARSVVKEIKEFYKTV
jgi:dTDP-4-amino-4,6-dideoxygalactose transaminase